MIKELKPFINIPAKPFYMKDIDSFGMLEFENLEKLRAGRDNLSMHFDERGLWLGHENFADAPFKVHINGVLEAPAVFAGYIQVGGAAADVNAGVTVIEGGKITVSGDSSFAAGYDPSTKLASADVGDMAFENLVQYAKLGTTIISGGYLQTALINADFIQAGTLTGRRIQTRVEGAWTRIMIGEHGHPSYSDQIAFFNLTGGLAGTIRGGDVYTIFAGRFLFPSGIGTTTKGVSFEGLLGYISFEVYEEVIKSRKILPLGTSEDLGGSAAANHWRDLYLSRDAIVNGTVNATAITATAIATTGLSVGSIFNLPSSGTLPSTCTDGQMYYKTGSNFGSYICVNSAWERIHSG